jgi:TIR domain
MGDFRPASLFVSYCHKDEKVIYPLIEMNEDLQRAAWVDYVHTPPGTDWCEAHKQAIKDSYRLVLLWTQNALASPNVEREWRWALECETTIVPVLLDNTPLPEELSKIHAVSLREFVFSKRNSLSLRRFPPVEWMGLGTSLDTVFDMIGAVLLLTATVLSVFGIRAESHFFKAIGWIALILCLIGVFNFIYNIPYMILRNKLRYRLSRIVVQSLKEWGNENRRHE